MRIINFSLLVISILILSSCVTAKKEKMNQKEQKPGTFVTCKSPRAKVCTKEYRPVCASIDNGVRCITSPCPSITKKSYSNSCTACADPKVIGYTPNGACR